MKVDIKLYLASLCQAWNVKTLFLQPIVHFGINLGSPTSILHPLCTSHTAPLSAYFTSPRKKAAWKDTRTRKKSGKNHETNPD